MAECSLYLKTQTPVGELTVVRNERGITAVYWEGDSEQRLPAYTAAQKAADDDALLGEAVRQLEGYFEGRRQRFELPLAPQGTTFQRKVWDLLSQIPYGQTWSYGELAEKLGDKRKARAVGMANNRNPLSILVPCHRVIGKTGSLVGFGGGLEAKKLLLDLETRSGKGCQKCSTITSTHSCHFTCSFCTRCSEAFNFACPNCNSELKVVSP